MVCLSFPTSIYVYVYVYVPYVSGCLSLHLVGIIDNCLVKS
jgi:hypothetical protein